jgi:hypothetical protein
MSVREDSISIPPRLFGVVAIDVVAGLSVYEAIGMPLRMANDKRAVAANCNGGSHIHRICLPMMIGSVRNPKKTYHEQ